MKARVMFKWENEAVRNVIADVEIYVGEKLTSNNPPPPKKSVSL